MPTALRLTKTDRRDSRGGTVLELARYDVKGAHLGTIEVCSGSPAAQVFRKAADSFPRSYEPIPEGGYALGDLLFASTRRGDYNATWGEGLGPVWTDVIPAPGNPTRREAIGIHEDANRSVAPGTAGCVGLRTREDVKRWVSWWEDAYGRPTGLIVDYGLGTVPPRVPASAPPRAPVVHYYKVFDKDGGRVLITPEGKRVLVTGLKVNGKPFQGGEILIGVKIE